jgi:hypothetical protein
VGCIFTAGWRVVSKLVKSCRNIVGHRNVNILLGVVAFYGEATIQFTFPVGGDGVKILKDAWLQAKLPETSGEIARAL